VAVRRDADLDTVGVVGPVSLDEPREQNGRARSGSAGPFRTITGLALERDRVALR